jgi:hypothetical protein
VKQYMVHSCYMRWAVSSWYQFWYQAEAVHLMWQLCTMLWNGITMIDVSWNTWFSNRKSQFSRNIQDIYNVNPNFRLENLVFVHLSLSPVIHTRDTLYYRIILEIIPLACCEMELQWYPRSPLILRKYTMVTYNYQ